MYYFRGLDGLSMECLLAERNRFISSVARVAAGEPVIATHKIDNKQIMSRVVVEGRVVNSFIA